MKSKLKKVTFVLIVIILFFLLLIGFVSTKKSKNIGTKSNDKPINLYKYKNKDINKNKKVEESVSEEIKTKYLVKFDNNGGEGNMKSITCPSSEICKLPNNLFKKYGYNFIGWSIKKNGNIILNNGSYFKNLSIEDKAVVTLYAKWEMLKFNIAFLDYDGKVLLRKMKNFNDIIDFPNSPSRIGYTFIGWDNDTKKVEKDEDYNAKYKINNYSILYNLDGGILDKKITTYNIETDNIKIGKPLKYGYIFTGWKSNNSSNIIENYIIKKGSYGDLILNAIYKPKEYKINFDTNGGKEKFASRTIKFNESYKELPIPTKRGYDFTGWFQNNELVDNNTIVNKDSNDNITLIAKWIPKEYNIALNPNGGYVGKKDIKIKYNEKYGNLPIPTKNGYKFIGWYYNQEKIEQDTILEVDCDHDLIAHWKENRYNVTYLNSDGTLFQKLTIRATEKIPNLDYNVDKYHVFKGWKDNNGLDISNINSPITSDIILKAIVSETNCYLLTGQAQDGDLSRISRFKDLLAEKNLTGRFNLENTGYYSYVTDLYNYSNIIEGARHLLNSASDKEWPNLKWLLISCDNGYKERLR